MQAAERELLDGEFAPGMPRRFQQVASICP